MGKSFSAAVADAAGTPIVFDIDGEEFSVARPLPGVPLSELAAKATDSGVAAMAGFLQFIQDVMDPEEYKRFREVAKRKRIELDQLTEISQYIIEEGTGRPKAPSTNSSES